MNSIVPLTQKPVWIPSKTYKRNKWLYFFTEIDTAKRALDNEFNEFRCKYLQHEKLILRLRSPKEVYQLWEGIGISRGMANFFIQLFGKRLLGEGKDYLLWVPDDKIVCLDPQVNIEWLGDLCNIFGFHYTQMAYYSAYHNIEAMPSMHTITQAEIDAIITAGSFDNITIGDFAKSVLMFRNKKLGKKCFWDPGY